MKCKLCKLNEADQTGSHIISAFLLSSQIGKRGEEKSFLITTDPGNNYFENRKDKDIKEDFILCRDCEKKLSFIENIFCAEITNKIEIEKYNQNFTKSNTQKRYFLECKKVNPIVFYLLIYSVIWRASISTQIIYEHFKIDNDSLEDLRFFMDLFLPTLINHEFPQNQKQWESMVENCQDIFVYFPFHLVKAENLAEKTGTYQFFDNLSKSPYHIMIGEYIIFPFFHDLEFSDDFFEMKNEIDLDNAINNKYESGKITVVDNCKFEMTVGKIQNLTLEKLVFELRKYYIGKLLSQGLTIDEMTINKLVLEHIEKMNNK